MKKIYSCVLLLTSYFSLLTFSYAQAPQGINYQAVARDGSGNPLVSTAVAIRFSVYNSIGPDTVWIETHSKTTNAFGLFTAIIGQGTKIGGSATAFANINWGAGTFYLRVWVNSSDMGITQFMSVPYALQSRTADSLKGGLGAKPFSKSGGKVFLTTNSDSVGIGTTAPAAKLHIIGTGTTSATYGLQVHNSTGTNNALVVTDAGNVGIGIIPGGSYKVEVLGKIKSTGINEISDIRYKKNISTIDNALNKVIALRGVNYDWRTDEFKDKNFDTAPQIGLIAQEVEKIIPQVVATDASGYKSVEYSKLVALLIEAVKEQQKKIESLQSAVCGLQNENQSLKIINEKEMQSLKADVKSLHCAIDVLLKESISFKEENK